MTTKTNIFMKRVMPVAMAVLMVLSVVLVPIHADAAAKPGVAKELILAKGQTWDLVTFDVADNAKVTYKTSKKTVATVSKKGKIKAKKKGTATITTTIKQGGKTYKLKTKVTVKNKITVHDAIRTAECDFVEYYNICANYANENGWAENKEAVEWLETYYELVLIIQEMSADKNAYEEEAMQQAYELMIPVMEDVQVNLPLFMEPYEG